MYVPPLHYDWSHRRSKSLDYKMEVAGGRGVGGEGGRRQGSKFLPD